MYATVYKTWVLWVNDWVRRRWSGDRGVQRLMEEGGVSNTRPFIAEQSFGWRPCEHACRKKPPQKWTHHGSENIEGASFGGSSITTWQKDTNILVIFFFFFCGLNLVWNHFEEKHHCCCCIFLALNGNSLFISIDTLDWSLHIHTNVSYVSLAYWFVDTGHCATFYHAAYRTYSHSRQY